MPSPIRPVRAWLDDRLDGGGDVVVVDEHRDLHLGQERRVVLAAQVAMEAVLLPTVTHRLADHPADDLDRLQRLEHRLCPEGFDQRDDLNQAMSLPGCPLSAAPRPRLILTRRAGFGRAPGKKWDP